MASTATPLSLEGKWYQAPADWGYTGQGLPDIARLTPVDAVSRTGGRFIFLADLNTGEAGTQVLDFKNSSVIGEFHHWVFDSSGHRVADAEGGIQSDADNPFLLRHGRELQLAPGHYRLVTELSSPFFLAYPQPYLDTLAHYRQAVKAGTGLVFLCLGILLGLGIYYAALALIRHSIVDGMYALFILGNLLYNGTALLVYPGLFGMHWFYLVSVPILFSNCAYAVFVMTLLDIRRDSHPRLYRIGVSVLGILGAFILLAGLMPNWSLELDRYGVGLFLLYGLVSGIVRAREGSLTARLYLVAIGAFFVLGSSAISLGSLHGVYVYYMEHLGLLAVTVEALLLALVVAQQFAQLRSEKEHALSQSRRNRKLAQTDALTGLPNRYALELALEQLPAQGSLTFIDLNGLKYYNDRFGHERGDELLCRFAAELHKRLPECACLHRLGGDEFAITCCEGDISRVEDRIAATVNVLHNGDFKFAGASFGSVRVAENPAKDDLMRMADERMYENKRSSRRLVPQPA
ncbi:GGDEF domain-containing protein [Sideroxydans lithotrophicus]|uniref:GGDEF domain-containing protein n=1 Tax=Sideroxydans lithotrophicus TaxID=63745 RepID=UPI001CBC9145|nr:diguanylate cyclase [Sideroxydans lithotrophicus]